MNSSEAYKLPAPKGFKCAAGCEHSIHVHRVAGCDGCDCPAPHGRILPSAEATPERTGDGDVQAAILADLDALHELVALYLPQFGTVRSDAFTRLDRIAALVRGEQQ